MKKKLLGLLGDKPFMAAAMSLTMAAIAYFNVDMPAYATTAIEWTFITGGPMLLGYLLPNKKQLDLAKSAK